MKDPVVLITGALTGIGRDSTRLREGHGHALPGWRLQRVAGTFSRISTKTPRYWAR